MTSSTQTRPTTDGFFAGDALIHPHPPQFVATAMAAAISQHEWRTITERWLADKKITLRAFDVLVDKGQLSVPWQSRYDHLPPGQGALQYALLSMATETRRSKRVAVIIEVSIDGEAFTGAGYGPYQEGESQASAVAPANEAIRQLVSEIAESAAGIATPRSSTQ